jgi:hypothetical protein
MLSVSDSENTHYIMFLINHFNVIPSFMSTTTGWTMGGDGDLSTAPSIPLSVSVTESELGGTEKYK